MVFQKISVFSCERMYPDDYKDITFVFNDIDTIPHKKGLPKYNTNIGVVKNFWVLNFRWNIFY